MSCRTVAGLILLQIVSCETTFDWMICLWYGPAGGAFEESLNSDHDCELRSVLVDIIGIASWWTR